MFQTIDRMNYESSVSSNPPSDDELIQEGTQHKSFISCFMTLQFQMLPSRVQNIKAIE